MARAPLELRPDVAPYGAQDSSCYVLSHGWLAVGHNMSPLPWFRLCPCAYSSAYAAFPLPSPPNWRKEKLGGFSI
jgi:hypothetical protein